MAPFAWQAIAIFHRLKIPIAQGYHLQAARAAIVCRKLGEAGVLTLIGEVDASLGGVGDGEFRLVGGILSEGEGGKEEASAEEEGSVHGCLFYR